MTTRAAAILFLLAVLAAAQVKADERPPRYDLDGHCSRLSNTSDGFSPESMSRCLSAQSDALESVRRVWPGTPAYIQRDCDLRAKANRDEDYLILERCLRDETRQSDEGTTIRPKPKPKPKPAPPPN